MAGSITVPVPEAGLQESADGAWPGFLPRLAGTQPGSVAIGHADRNGLARLVAQSDDPYFPAASVLIDELLHNGGRARLASAMFDRPMAPGWEVET
jgi:hypothetical protein